MKTDTLRFMTGMTITLLWIAFFLWLLHSCAGAHERLIFIHDWYPSICCGGQDCHPIPCSEIEYEKNTGIWWWKGHSFFTAPPSPDGLCHVCVHDDRGICLFVGGTS